MSSLFSVGLHDGIVEFASTDGIPQKHQYVLVISVRDSGEPPRETVVTITVQMMQHPKFEQSQYTTTVSETEPVGATLLTVVATDDKFVSLFLYLFLSATRSSYISVA